MTTARPAPAAEAAETDGEERVNTTQLQHVLEFSSLHLQHKINPQRLSLIMERTTI